MYQFNFQGKPGAQLAEALGLKKLKGMPAEPKPQKVDLDAMSTVEDGATEQKIMAKVRKMKSFAHKVQNAYVKTMKGQKGAKNMAAFKAVGNDLKKLEGFMWADNLNLKVVRKTMQDIGKSLKIVSSKVEEQKQKGQPAASKLAIEDGPSEESQEDD